MAEGAEQSQEEVFVVLPREDKGEAPRASLSHRLKVASRLFDAMTEKTNVNHPLCHDCTEQLQKRMEQRVDELEEEIENHKKYKEQLESTSKSNVAKLEQDVKALKIKEDQSMTLLKQLAAKKKTLEQEQTALELESKELDNMEVALWRDWDVLQGQVKEYDLERDSMDLKIDHAVKWLERLQKSNVYNDAFRISHDGQFGTINGFRLGRLPNHPVDWTEINAALGQAMLLLYTLAKRVNFKFSAYKLVPNGSFSRLERTDDKTVLELYVLFLKLIISAMEVTRSPSTDCSKIVVSNKLSLVS